MAGVFLLACNFTDAWLLGLNSLRFSRFRVDRGWASLYSLSLMRSCDGTSGLVRGNRRKAVFAFKRLFSQRNLSRFPLQGARRCCVFRKCGEKSKTSEHNPIFTNKTAGRGSAKPGSGRSISVFPSTSGPLVESMWQNQESPSTPPFLRRETAGRGVAASRCARQVLNLPHTSDLRPCGRPRPLISSAR